MKNPICSATENLPCHLGQRAPQLERRPRPHCQAHGAAPSGSCSTCQHGPNSHASGFTSNPDSEPSPPASPGGPSGPRLGGRQPAKSPSLLSTCLCPTAAAGGRPDLLLQPWPCRRATHWCWQELSSWKALHRPQVSNICSLLECWLEATPLLKLSVAASQGFQDSKGDMSPLQLCRLRKNHRLSWGSGQVVPAETKPTLRAAGDKDN